ncbi:hypothetical protein ASD64_07110 [Mesorhizobium sp. Root157]|uniref:hypothetical protein n=1 Tax=Mesorhizobium sp. Root157 TaxID=1736477 RepID=UPI0006F91D74|nr:hypothetical protein [Mesorhizobium sp. Root157]KQZ87203.1 hypothetical protein ASD64_07110 [Mesorhizobium sp. Root157]
MPDPKNKKAEPGNDADDSDVRKGPVITITASESRRRCGRRFPKGQPVEVAESDFNEGQWREIIADPVLKITPPID